MDGQRLTVGDLRALLANLPDSALVRPDFIDSAALVDEAPSVTIEGAELRVDANGQPYLSVLVDLTGFDDEFDDEFDDDDDPLDDDEFDDEGDDDYIPEDL